MSKKILVTGGLLLIGLAIGSFFYLNQDDEPEPTKTSGTIVHFSDEATGVSLDYDSSLVKPVSLSQRDQDDKVILQLTDKGGDSKPLLFTVRYEEGLAAAAAITKQSVIDHLEGSANLTLPKRAGYRLIDSNRTTVDGRPAIKFVFTYSANQDTPTKQQLLIIPTSNDRAVYIAQQATEADYNSVEKEVFQPILETFKLQR